MKAKTIKLGSADYAKVSERIKLFREDCPNGDIDTDPLELTSGLVFKATVIKDKANPETCARATGHAQSVKKGEKAFEKLETIAVGRALANLGYMASGEIASTEEMEEFIEYKNEKLEGIFDKVDKAKTEEELKQVWEENKGLGKDFAKLVTDRKNEIAQS